VYLAHGKKSKRLTEESVLPVPSSSLQERYKYLPLCTLSNEKLTSFGVDLAECFCFNSLELDTIEDIFNCGSLARKLIDSTYNIYSAGSSGNSAVAIFYSAGNFGNSSAALCYNIVLEILERVELSYNFYRVGKSKKMLEILERVELSNNFYRVENSGKSWFARSVDARDKRRTIFQLIDSTFNINSAGSFGNSVVAILYSAGKFGKSDAAICYNIMLEILERLELSYNFYRVGKSKKIPILSLRQRYKYLPLCNLSNERMSNFGVDPAECFCYNSLELDTIEHIFNSRSFARKLIDSVYSIYSVGSSGNSAATVLYSARNSGNSAVAFYVGNFGNSAAAIFYNIVLEILERVELSYNFYRVGNSGQSWFASSTDA
ncbi:hypothetical protein H5410_005976, partial [Solanum commersonii]